MDDACGKNATGAICREDGLGDLGLARNVDDRAAKISAVSGRERHWLRGVDGALDQPAPFHVVEEEGLLALSVVQLSESDRATDVEAEDIQAQFGHRLGRGVEEVACVECIIAIELPSRSVERAGTGLEHHGHGATRRKAIVGAVIGSQSTELCDCVAGRSNAHAAGAATVIILATIEQVDVVVLAHAVEFDAGVTTYRSIDDARAHAIAADLARCSRS